MADYEKMYYELFNAILISIDTLQKAQLNAEDLFINSPEASIIEIDNIKKISLEEQSINGLL